MSKITDSQSRVLAKLCIYAILATLESIEHSPQKKRPRADDDDESSPMAKMRKTGIDSAVEGSPTEKESSAQQLKEPLKNSLQELFKVFHQQVANDEMSLKVNFIFQFFSLLVQFEKSIKIKSVLKLIPNGLITNMLKIIPHEDLTYGLVLRQVFFFSFCFKVTILIKSIIFTDSMIYQFHQDVLQPSAIFVF